LNVLLAQCGVRFRNKISDDASFVIIVYHVKKERSRMRYWKKISGRTVLCVNIAVLRTTSRVPLISSIILFPSQLRALCYPEPSDVGVTDQELVTSMWCTF
jgi:hypothetical protein